MEAIEKVDNKVDKLWRQHEVHLAEGHEIYVRRTEIESQLSDFTAVVKEWLQVAKQDRDSIKLSLTTIDDRQQSLAAVVLGEPHLNYDGEWERKGGLQAIVNDYQNGGGKGLRATISWQQITAIITAVLTVGGGVIIAIINSGGV